MAQDGDPSNGAAVEDYRLGSEEGVKLAPGGEQHIRAEALQEAASLIFSSQGSENDVRILELVDVALNSELPVSDESVAYYLRAEVLFRQKNLAESEVAASRALKLDETLVGV